MEDRPTKGSAKLVADELGLARARGKEGAGGVEDRVAIVVICLAVEVVRATTNRHVDDCTRVAPVLRRVVVRFHAKLVHCVRRWRDVLVGKTLVAGAVVVVV